LSVAIEIQTLTALSIIVLDFIDIIIPT